jgi:lantibiotic biosynthesis protein
MASWRPVLVGSESEEALSVVRDIGEAVARQPITGATPGLARGHAGTALLFAYAHEADESAGWAELAQARLDVAADGVAALPLDASLFTGFSGVAWGAEHIAPGSPTGEDASRDVDAALAERLAASPWSGDYDLVTGLVGMGLFALDRMETASEPGHARACAIRVVDHLEALAEELDGGLAWRTQPRFLPPGTSTSYPDGLHDLGVAHGVPGVVVLLALLRASGVEAARTDALLQGAFTWLTRQRNPDSMASRYGYHTIPASGARSTSRLAWCYGDLGISAALLWAARAGGGGPLESGLEDEAILTAHRTCSRAPSDCGVLDAGLCHGSAGLALLYARLYNATGEDRFREHARLWYRGTMERRGAGDPGLLTGAAGIGLSLLAGATEIEPGWDRMLLASVPPR